MEKEEKPEVANRQEVRQIEKANKVNNYSEDKKRGAKTHKKRNISQSKKKNCWPECVHRNILISQTDNLKEIKEECDNENHLF